MTDTTTTTTRPVITSENPSTVEETVSALEKFEDFKKDYFLLWGSMIFPKSEKAFKRFDQKETDQIQICDGFHCLVDCGTIQFISVNQIAVWLDISK
jgi:hypothetical protein